MDNFYSQEEILNNFKYLNVLSEKYKNITEAVTEVINLKAILNLPKATEHFLTDIHGESDAFNHVMQNASGAIKRKVVEEFENENIDLKTFTSLIYYPEEMLEKVKRDYKKENKSIDEFYEKTIYYLVRVARKSAFKYTRSKVRKMLPKDFAYIMDELIQENENRSNKKAYYNEIIKSIVYYDRADVFIIKMCEVIKKLVIDHLHIIGDIFDRGPHPDIVMDTLMEIKNLDIQWGNHDIVWMGAAAGSKAAIANVLRMALRYSNNDVIENAYGINLLPLATFSEKIYGNDPCKKFMPKEHSKKAFDLDENLIAKMHKAISVIQFKVEEQTINEHPEYNLDDRKIMSRLNLKQGTVKIDGKDYELLDKNFPTVDEKNPSKLTLEEENIIEDLRDNFVKSEKLQRHIRFLYAKGSMYKTFNNNLLFHACLNLNEDGSFKEVLIDGKKYSGKALMDKYDQMARKAYFSKENVDFLWYLWLSEDSTLFGKDKMATFERYLLDDEKVKEEILSPYYHLLKGDDPKYANKILKEFGLDEKEGHIINGHTPVKTKKGESPIKAGGKRLVIDGGFSKAYQSTTGIAGYTLTYNSYGLTLISHNPFESVDKVINEGFDIKSTKKVIEKMTRRKLVSDTDIGTQIKEKVKDLEMLITAYKLGILKPRN